LFNEIAILICLLLATYGLACCITSFVLWLIASVREKPYCMLVFLCEQDPIRSHLIAVRERLNNGGLRRSTELVLVDCGMNEIQRRMVDEYCAAERCVLLKKEELQEYLEIRTFQTDKHAV